MSNASIFECNNITQLPADIISKCCSFLKMDDYSNFRSTNRIIYLSPNSLYSLSIQHIPDNLITFQKKYMSIRTLTTNISVLNNMTPISTDYKWNHIESLTLMDYDGDLNDSDLEEFIGNLPTTMDCTKVRILKCAGSFESPELFLTLLFSFPNLEEIYLLDNFSLNDANYSYHVSDTIKLRNLTGIVIENFAGKLKNQLISICTLKMLALGFGSGDITGLDALQFTELQELTIPLTDANKDVIGNIMKTATQLEHITLLTGCCCSGAECEFLIPPIIEKQPSLKTLHICMDVDGVVWVADGLETGLFSTMRYKRDYFKLILEVPPYSFNEILMYSVRIVQLLQLSDIKDFMLVMKVETYNMAEKQNKDYIKQAQDMLQQTFTKNRYKPIMLHFDDELFLFAISNSDKLVCNTQLRHGKLLKEM
eukprot:523706_1